MKLGPTLRTWTALALIAHSATAFAQEKTHPSFPSKPVRIVVPYAAGGGADFVARTISDGLAKTWSQSVIVENRPGASGAIAANFVAKSLPDGHTLLLGNTALIQAPAMQLNLPYDVFKDFVAVAQVISIDDVLIESSALRAATVQEFSKLMVATPGHYSFGSYGNGTSSHLHGALMNMQIHADLVHVPYPGSAPLLSALLGGQIAAGFVDMSAARAHLQSTKVRVLATTGKTRSKLLPGTPTMTELGYKDFEPSGFAGVLAPAGTPSEIVNKIAADVDALLRVPAMARRFTEAGLQPVGGTSEDFSALMRRDAKVWGRIATQAGIKLE